MKVLVTGVNGQLGYDVVKKLASNHIECIGVGRKEFDITNEKETMNFIVQYNPDVVVHCAAYTAVDKAEDERELCYNINVLGTRYISLACEKINAKMVYISTDYVFDGKGDLPFGTDYSPEPINYYGQTKYLGELEVQKLVNKYFIVRISWVFGINGNNFIKTMLKLGKDRDELTVVADQVGSPTYTYDLAELIVTMCQTEKYGTYHATNEGDCSWYEFACEIFKGANINVKVTPIKTEQYPTRAIRPANSRLSKDELDHAGFSRLPHWKDATKRYIDILTQEK